MQQRGIIDKVGRDGGKVRHTQHRIVNAHTVPCYLGMRGRGTPKSHCGQCGTSVVLDKNGRVECQHIGHRQGDVLFHGYGIEASSLHAYILHWAFAHYRNFGNHEGAFRPIFGAVLLFLFLRCKQDRAQQNEECCYKFSFHDAVIHYFQQKAPGMIPT